MLCRTRYLQAWSAGLIRVSAARTSSRKQWARAWTLWGHARRENSKTSWLQSYVHCRVTGNSSRHLEGCCGSDGRAGADNSGGGSEGGNAAAAAAVASTAFRSGHLVIARFKSDFPHGTLLVARSQVSGTMKPSVTRDMTGHGGFRSFHPRVGLEHHMPWRSLGRALSLVSARFSVERMDGAACRPYARLMISSEVRACSWSQRPRCSMASSEVRACSGQVLGQANV